MATRLSEKRMFQPMPQSFRAVAVKRVREDSGDDEKPQRSENCCPSASRPRCRSAGRGRPAADHGHEHGSSVEIGAPGFGAGCGRPTRRGLRSASQRSRRQPAGRAGRRRRTMVCFIRGWRLPDPAVGVPGADLAVPHHAVDQPGAPQVSQARRHWRAGGLLVESLIWLTASPRPGSRGAPSAGPSACAVRKPLLIIMPSERCREVPIAPSLKNFAWFGSSPGLCPGRSGSGRGCAG